MKSKGKSCRLCCRGGGGGGGGGGGRDIPIFRVHCLPASLDLLIGQGSFSVYCPPACAVTAYVKKLG